ncbi:uncharacterized protein SPSK_04443 [Sporothrix schenckii 1099-18]|uniref:Uncharacterized protein n=1 Tax=Sporothrix schenckii 1099-18 TaxID=1397361 RepID=A0A0F2M3X1_SPOSC|nr:uncharacterized protein SPSK_04443 [Sporothrix schenckii 1099-18]KJR82866.1 hypothetical protein SPSK_04443 [Sporothrix schenckii 1099-18]
MASPPCSPSAEYDETSTLEDVRYSSKSVPRISLHNFEARVGSVTADIAAAAKQHGHRRTVLWGFFALPDEIKANTPYATSCDAGWEQETMFVPPSAGETAAANMQLSKEASGQSNSRYQKKKEMYCMQLNESRMARRWVSDKDLQGVRHQSQSFMQACHLLSMRLMVCLARGLGYTKENGKDDHVFAKAHAMSRQGIQTVLRAQRYYVVDQPRRLPSRVPTMPTMPSMQTTPTTPTTPTATNSPSSQSNGSAQIQVDRSGSATHADLDWSFLTLRFLRPGQSGLEICPGRKTVTRHTTSANAEWTKIEIKDGDIVCNV